MFSPKCETFALQVAYVTPNFAGHSFRVTVFQVKLGTFLPIAVVHFDFCFNLKYIFMSLCKYNS